MKKNEIINGIDNSHRAQRNWDLNKTIPKEHIDVIKYAAKWHPSKQNRVWYKAVFIQDREIIEHIQKTTDSFCIPNETPEDGRGFQQSPDHPVRTFITNSQIMSNLIVVLVNDRDYSVGPRTELEERYGVVDGQNARLHELCAQDQERAIGVAAGYIAYTGALLGYKTGFFDARRNQDLLEKMFGDIVHIIVGIGHPDKNRDRCEHHHDPGRKFYSLDRNTTVEDEVKYKDQILSVDVTKFKSKDEEILDEIEKHSGYNRWKI